MSDSVRVAQTLESAGVGFIHVSSGIVGWRRPSRRNGEGYLVSEAAQIQAEVQIPVIAVGGIETGAYIDESLRLGRFRLAAVGRAILNDPASWSENQLQRTKSTKPRRNRPVPRSPSDVIAHLNEQTMARIGSFQ